MKLSINRDYFSLSESRGFTLIELLIIITVLAILATVVFVALNPMARFQDARNSRRWTDINSIMGAIKLYQVDHGGSYPGDIDTITEDQYYEIGSAASCSADTCTLPGGATLQADCLNFGTLVDNGYVPSLPIDPNAAGASDTNTFYYFMKNSNKAITVGACNAEKGSADAVPVISVSR